MANIFVSHRTDDIIDAERLSIELQNAGHNVWLDKWKIDIGDSIINRINEGLEGSSYVVVCYSSRGIMSLWMSIEWMSTLARQLNGFNVKILPAMLAGGSPPAILSGIKYANLGLDWNKGISDILRSIR